MKINGDCPHCKEKVAIDIDKLEVKQPKTLEHASSESQVTQTIEKEPEVKEVIKEVEKIPSNIPNYQCKDGRCGNVHPNPDYHDRPTKKCENCGQFSTSETCIWCNGKDFEDIDPGDRDWETFPHLPSLH